MTSRNQPHKYRCETCKTDPCPVWISSNRVFVQCGKKFENEYDRWVDVISAIGCHFHSSAIEAEQRIADAIDGLQSEIDNPDGADYQDAVLTALALLREKGE